MSSTDLEDYKTHEKYSPAETEYDSHEHLYRDRSYAVGQETSAHNLAGALALRKIVDKGFVYHLTSAYNSDVIVFPDNLWTENVLMCKYDDQGNAVSAYWEWDDALVDAYFAGEAKSKGQIDVFAKTKKRAEKLLREYKKWVVPSKRIIDENSIVINFWNDAQQGPRKTPRRIEVPSWSDIKGNYAGKVQDTLDEMVNDFVPAHGGQLILWHGHPGTGKTYALRALARSWRSWCEAEYIVDPDRFFGSDSDYLMRVLLAEPSNSHHYRHLVDDDEEGEEDTPSRWRLLICEDTGELLDIEAKDRAGQGLSRLLNTVDGLIGQGLKVLVLITTNEPLPKLHAAVSRSGRASVVLEFTALDSAESKAWGAKHGITVESKPHRLADLYAASEGYRHDMGSIASQVGFTKRVDTPTNGVLE